MGWIANAAAIPALNEALHAPDIYVRDNAAWALGQIQDAAAIPTLTEALRDSRKEARPNTTKTLGESEEVIVNEDTQTIKLLGDR